MSYFVNYSNHPSSAWSSDQIAAAHKYGDIIDIPFPNVSASSGEEEILQTAKDGVADNEVQSGSCACAG